MLCSVVGCFLFFVWCLRLGFRVFFCFRLAWLGLAWRGLVFEALSLVLPARTDLARKRDACEFARFYHWWCVFFCVCVCFGACVLLMQWRVSPPPTGPFLVSFRSLPVVCLSQEDRPRSPSIALKSLLRCLSSSWSLMSLSLTPPLSLVTSQAAKASFRANINPF